jgi:ABC-type glycerol-3-phosphate transport system substrate-binding protein
MMRNTTLGGILIAAVVLATAACGTSSSQGARPAVRPAVSTTAPAATAQASTQPPSVSQQVADWFNGGGGNQLKAVAADSETEPLLT